MSRTRLPKPKWWAQALCSLLFFFTGLPFLRYPGLQNDEMLFAAPIYRPADAVYTSTISHYDVSVMVMSYVGALKTWLFVPILHFIRPSPFLLRMPMLFLGSVTVWLVFHWVEKAHSRRAAWIGALLVATDTMYLLTTCFDWGPVALQHFLTVSGVVLVFRFHHQRSTRVLAAAFFCFGLAFWDKALFIWIGAGLLCALPLLFLREAWSHLSFRTVLAASLGFIAGAFPLIAYNVHEHYPTFQATQGFTTQELYPKTFVARGTWEGAALFGFVANEDTAPSPRGPRNALEAASFRLRSIAGEHKRNALDWAALAGLVLLLPAIWWRSSRRIVLFCLIVSASAWFLMGITRGAGAAAHHVLLLWPFPHIALAVIFAETTRRLQAATPRRAVSALLGIGMTVFIVANLLVTNQYLYQLARDGAARSWSDAIYPMAEDLGQIRGHRIAITDWGIANPLDVLTEGREALEWCGTACEGSPGPVTPDAALLNDPGTLWVGHTDGYELFSGVNARVAAFARRAGLEKAPVRTYLDTNGRGVLESFRLQKK